MRLRELDMGAVESIPDFKVINANSQCITHSLLIELGKYDNPYLKKLCVDLRDEKEEIKFDLIPDDIGVVDMEFDFTKYRQLTTDFDKKSMLLDAMYYAIVFTTKKLNLDITPFEKARNQLLDNSISTDFYWRKAKSNKSRNMKAQVFYNFNMNNIELGVQILSKDDEIIFEKIIEQTLPNVMFITPYLGQLKWLDNNTVTLIAKNGIDEFTVNVNC